jgi:hypothetical protein
MAYDTLKIGLMKALKKLYADLISKASGFEGLTLQPKDERNMRLLMETLN